MFHPAVSTWFSSRFSSPTDAQTRGWPEISAGRDTLIMAPTGSGKTLAAFLTGIDSLVRRAATGSLDERIRVLYVSPLKALGADVERNLEIPLAGICQTAPNFGLLPPPIRTALRTGDTPPAERQRILRHPPHVLITTPESLYLMVTSDRGREALTGVETVIVDEIHALYGNKRGAHFAITLERLDAICKRRVQRVGLSATVSHPDEVARFLTGVTNDGAVRPCAIVDAGRAQKMDVAIEIPTEPLSSVASTKASSDIYDRVAELIRAHKTTLVFVVSRRMAERVSRALEERLGEGAVVAHHGALSRRTRLSVEARLKSGDLRAVVATSSLELGIDVGAVDLVCQIGSPGSIAVLRQRIGRADHNVGGVPKGRIFSSTRDDLLDCAAAVRAMRAGVIDRPVVRDAPLDVLAQQLIAEVGTGPRTLDGLYALCKRAAPYSALSRAEFDDVFAMISDGVSTRRGRAGAHLFRDRMNGVARPRRGARLAAVTSGGAIPDTALYDVTEEPTGQKVGQLDEHFAIETSPGDIFVLGTHSWRVARVDNTAGRVLVTDAAGAPPTLPFWAGEAPGRSAELSESVSSLRRDLVERARTDHNAALQWMIDECGVDVEGARQSIAYLTEGADALGVVPAKDCIVAERFFDESGGMQLVLHAPFGARINRAWGLALRKRFCRTFDFELQAAATDDAVLLSLGEQHSFPLDSVFAFLHPNTVRETLIQAILPLPIWETRWRWAVTRSLTVLRFTKGHRTPPHLLRMRAADLAAAVFPAQVGCQDNRVGDNIELPDHPLVNETARDCVEDALDVEGLRAVVGEILDGKIRCVAKDTVTPSPWAHGILTAKWFAWLDDAPLEERRTRAVLTARPGELRATDLSVLDRNAVDAVVSDAQPTPRDADELADVLSAVGFVAPSERWRAWFEQLKFEGRATTMRRGTGNEDWVAAERVPMLRALFAHATFHPEPLLDEKMSLYAGAREDALREVVGARLSQCGPVSIETLSLELGLDAGDVAIALAALESEGRILQGPFTAVGATDWCERHLLQRIHRRTLMTLREQVRAVSPGDLVRFLLRWQHVAPGTQLHGPEGLHRVIEQLEGLELHPSAWEKHVFPARIADYSPAWLDELCLSGEVAWSRLEVTPPDQPMQKTSGSAGSIAIYLRSNAPHLLRAAPDETPPPWTWPNLSELARNVAAELDRRGATFLRDLAQSLSKPIDAIENALWELVKTGVASSDSFHFIRQKSGGRWTLLPKPVSQEETLRDPFVAARRVLRRWGVVTRELLAREGGTAEWRKLLPILRRLEARGEIRGGRFVAGLSGEQFALPEALDALRALPRATDEERVVLAATDPLNLVGIVTHGPRLPATLGRTLTWVQGIIESTPTPDSLPDVPVV